MGRNRKSNRGSTGASKFALLQSAVEASDALQRFLIENVPEGEYDEESATWQQKTDKNSIGLRFALLEENIHHKLENLVSIGNPETHRAILKQLRSQRVLSYADQLALYAIAMMSAPDVRWEALQFYDNYIDQTGGKKAKVTLEVLPLKQTGYVNSRDVLWYLWYSLDYKLLQNINYLNRGRKRKIPVSEIANLDQLPRALQETLVNEFMSSYTKLHTDGATYNMLGAAMQTAMGEVGVNKGLPFRSFYLPHVMPPRPNPLMVQLLQRQYEITQAFLADNPTSLWRGMSGRIQLGIPMSPWTTEQIVALSNAEEPERLVYQASIPKEYIFMTSQQRNFQTKYSGENEYLVLETALAGKSVSKSRETLSSENKEFLVEQLDIRP